MLGVEARRWLAAAVVVELRREGRFVQRGAGVLAAADEGDLSESAVDARNPGLTDIVKAERFDESVRISLRGVRVTVRTGVVVVHDPKRVDSDMQRGQHDRHRDVDREGDQAA